MKSFKTITKKVAGAVCLSAMLVSSTGFIGLTGASTVQAANTDTIKEFDITIAGIKDFIWTGKPVTQDDFTIYRSGSKLTEGTDYTVTYTGNMTEPGQVTVTIDFADPNIPDYVTHFNIEAISVDDATIELENNSYAYTGAAIEPKVKKITLADGNVVNPAKADMVTIHYKDNVEIGRGCVYITGNNHYTGMTEKYFTIKNASSGGNGNGSDNGNGSGNGSGNGNGNGNGNGSNNGGSTGGTTGRNNNGNGSSGNSNGNNGSGNDGSTTNRPQPTHGINPAGSTPIPSGGLGSNTQAADVSVGTDTSQGGNIAGNGGTGGSGEAFVPTLIGGEGKVDGNGNNSGRNGDTTGGKDGNRDGENENQGDTYTRDDSVAGEDGAFNPDDPTLDEMAEDDGNTEKFVRKADPVKFFLDGGWIILGIFVALGIAVAIKIKKKK